MSSGHDADVVTSSPAVTPGYGPPPQPWADSLLLHTPDPWPVTTVPHVGAWIDHFRILRVLGQGGMGQVLLARDTILGRLVAIKVLLPDRIGADRVAQLVSEARVTARLSHPHIVSIFAVGKVGSLPYLALEYLDGESLRNRMDRAPLAVREVLRTALPVAQALQAAHAAGVTHHDLKPENVLLPRDGRLRVVDFGIAAVVDAERPASQRPSLSGTPGYMAPERWLGEPGGPPADVWSLGVLIHELVAGHRPFEGPRQDPRPLYRRVLEATQPPVLEGDAEVAGLVQACLAPDPAARPTAAELIERIERLLHATAEDGRSADAPFRGLLAFEERHSAWFFGRDAEIDLLLERLRTSTVLPLVGPSGAGKSSLVQAGLVPRLREQGPWLVIPLRPGPQPLQALSTRLLRETTLDSERIAGLERDQVERLAGILRERPREANLRLHRLAEETGRRVLLFVDQLEEIATQGVPPDEIDAFLEAIGNAADPVDDLVRVVFTVRDDFLGKIARGEAMRQALAHVAVVRRLDASHLRAAAQRPLDRLGYVWDDPTVIDAMVAELEGEPAALPLLQFACATFWERRDRPTRRLLGADYRTLGGVAGTLAAHGEQVLAGLTADQLDMARSILLRLVAPEGARRVIEKGEALAGLPPEAADVLERLCQSRLLTAQRPRDGRRVDAVVELAHESLIRKWPQLVRWVEESTEERALLADVEQAARLWDKRGRRAEEVWRGDALADVLRRLKSRDGLSSQAQAFLQVSELAQARLARRQRWTRGAIVGALSLALAVATWVAWQNARLARAAADIGRFELALEPFEWDVAGKTARPVDATKLPALTFELWDPDAKDPNKPGKPRISDEIQVGERRIESGRLVHQVETRSGSVFVRFTGRGTDGRECGPSWLRLRQLPGYADRDAEPPVRFSLVVPTCAATYQNLVQIPAGPFVFGGTGDPVLPLPSPPEPEQILDLPTFHLARTEVPKWAYAIYGGLGAWTGDPVPAYPDEQTSPGWAGANKPAAMVDVYTAERYCAFLGLRLPSTQEWTKAGRGGLWLDAAGLILNPVPRRSFTWGHGQGRAVIGRPNDADRPRVPPVDVDADTGDVSPYGVFHLGGNVSEWTSSPYQALRVIRGGSFTLPPLAGQHVLGQSNVHNSTVANYGSGIRCAL